MTSRSCKPKNLKPHIASTPRPECDIKMIQTLFAILSCLFDSILVVYVATCHRSGLCVSTGSLGIFTKSRGVWGFEASEFREVLLYISLCTNLLQPFRCHTHPNDKATLKSFDGVLCNMEGVHWKMSFAAEQSFSHPMCPRPNRTTKPKCRPHLS